jgi:hypothetical protein
VTEARLVGIIRDLVNTVVVVNGYNPATGANGGDRELAQGEIGKALIKLRPQILGATGLPENTALVPLAKKVKSAPKVAAGTTPAAASDEDDEEEAA